jgi:hypothetical protein
VTPRSFGVLACLLAVVAAGCTGPATDGPDASPTAGRTTTPPPVERLGEFQRLVCRLPAKHLLRIQRGVDLERSGEVQIVPEEPNFIGRWLSHSGPWDYVQRIPVFFYGPGQVAARGRLSQPATMADVAPTTARLIGYDSFDTPDGAAIEEAVAPDRSAPARLVLTMVWDSVGRNVLAEHPDAWPNLRRAIEDGVWMDRAVVGSSPSVTPAIHTTLGTGVFPARHGLVDLRFDVGGRLVTPHAGGPHHLRTPTLGDLFDRDRDNEPLVGAVTSQNTLGMLGSGSFLEGGDRDLAALKRRGAWEVDNVNREWFAFPAYVNDVGGLDQELTDLDRADGVLDGAWMGEEVLEDPDDIEHTPAFARYQVDVLAEVIRREGFGADDVPDLLYTNFRQPDKVGHRWSMNSPQMEAVVRSSDEAFGELVRILDREVGRGRWAVVITSDHGSTPRPDVTGAFVIDNRELEADLEAAFGAGALRSLRVTQLWLDTAVLEANGHTVKDVARFLQRYTKGDSAADPSTVPPDERSDRVFAAAFPTAALDGLACP